MEKEKLTRDKFLIDFAKSRVVHIVISNLFIYSLMFLCLYLISIMLKYAWIYKVSGVFFASLYLYELIKFICRCFLLKKGKYFILKDSLIGCSDDRSNLTVAILLRYSHYVPPRLYFKGYGTFYISRGEHYFWSSNNRMFESSVYNSSNIGDEFYIVSFDKKRIALVYNTKLFDLVS